MDKEEVRKFEQRFVKLTNIVNNSFIVDHSIHVELRDIEKKLNQHYEKEVTKNEK